ncbi:c2H2-type zinc-finger domain-containing protein [Ditylenchus destructor]|uniref:C2H2-type zinc-finger domain-containing protein n=1 Tax=Ditylenchus destructor TaxID=166010 RepID=A0AAD4N443_9BILA|nr:c2H2-type zinc-finger domain-containing protein [Ditylenchus destructor]
MKPPDDTKRNGHRLNGHFGSLFSNKPGGVIHFTDLISEMPDISVVIDDDIDPVEFVRQCMEQAQCGLDRNQISIPQRSDEQRLPHDFLEDRRRFRHIKSCCARTRPFVSNKTEQVTAMETDQDAKLNTLSAATSSQYAEQKEFPLDEQNCCARTRPFVSNKAEQVTAMETDQDGSEAKLNALSADMSSQYAEQKELPLDEQVDKSQRRPRRKAKKNSSVYSAKTKPNVTKLFNCDQCSITCENKTQLQKHMHTHTDQKPYKCDMCSYASEHKNDLLTHNRTHTDEKPYKCDQCSFAGTSKQYFKQHMRTHSGGKPYKCNMCSYASAHKRALQTHIRTHTREKPYNCDQCSFACAQPSSLKRHIRTHLRSYTGEKSNKCDQCNFASAKRNGVKIHKRIHKEAIPSYKGNKETFQTPERSSRRKEESVPMDTEEAEEYVPEIDLSFSLEDQNIMLLAVEAHHQSEYWKEMCNVVAARSEK